MLKKALEGVLTTEENNELISAFDQIGSIIIVRIPESIISKKKIIGEALLDQVKIAKSVFYQASAVEGDFRTRDLEILAGEDNTETEYKEFGCKFTVDVKNAFFSPRLSTERERIADLVQNNEVMTNMFAGVGMFSIMAAKKKEMYCIQSGYQSSSFKSMSNQYWVKQAFRKSYFNKWRCNRNYQ